MSTEPPELLLADAAGWQEWLGQHHGDSPDGVMLVLAKKGTGQPTSLRYDDALDEALCWGWIDGKVRRRDETTYCTRFTPRRTRSIWSRRNVGHVARLTEAGRMRPPGVAEVERAQADGRWAAAYGGVAETVVPPDLAAALAADPLATAMFDVLTSQNRFAILFRLQAVKRPETRARKITGFVSMLAAGETVYPQRRRPPAG